ncbi:MAG TPA: o-succinylbenzoate--CoA ligase [Gemmatimonadaceae bacterium]|nr:o-succinylbenzoate--CoA ligase [Gemmatimonadaceae bacterium]
MALTADVLPDWLAHRAATTPERTALVAGGRAWSFAELDADATRTTRRLAALGARAGDRVAMLLHNGPDAAMLVHAALRMGLTLVPLNVRLSADELAWQLGDAAPRVLVVEGRTAALADRARRERPELVTVSVDAAGAAMLGGHALDAVGEADAPALLAHDPETVVAIVYTSGTTGQPKGAMLTVGNFWWSAVGSALNLGTHADDRWLVCLPLFHVGGLSILLRATIYGIAAIVHDGFDAATVNRALDTERVSIVSLVAVMLQRLLDERGDRPYPPSLRCALLGGGPAPRALLERCARAGIPVVQTYGLTETASQVATLAPEDALRKLGAAGRPLYPNALRVVTDDGRDARVGEAGEILVRGPVVMAGYAGRPDATARAIVDGWLHTGDVGHLDADGYLHVLDRRDDLIVTGGENVYPAEVEAALLAHPWVAEAAVFGVPDDTWGQRVVAVIRLAAGVLASADAAGETLRAHCRSQLAGYKTPREIRLATEPLLRTASGKLRRGALRDVVSGPAASPPSS